jgi:hypothetical protein
MSILYKESNKETARELFEKKEFYSIDTTSDYTNLVDFEFAEKMLYGRVDQFFQPIVVNNLLLKPKRVPSVANSSQEVYALNFVVDMFEKLKKQFQKKLMKGEISSGEDFLSDLAAYKGYINPTSAYNAHLKSYTNAFEKIVKNRNIKFLNFDQFVGKLTPFLSKTIRKRPFTLPAFIKSTYCPINVSGLVIEIADIKCDNDLEKIKKFYESRNWEFYLTTCANMGFMVDRNNPWRLVADISSAPMADASMAYGVETIEQIMNSVYKKAHRGYLDSFKVIMYNMYSSLKRKRFTRLVETDQGGSRIVTQIPIEYSYQQFIEDHDDAYFLKLYCKMRFIEEESKFTKSEQNRIIDNVIELSNEDLRKAVDSFEIILNKTFDYRGSLSYINKSLGETRK